jgi:flavin reductase
VSSNKQTDLAQQMRLGMRRLASGVCVVTAIDEHRNRLAMTASSITSLSDAPPSLLVCIHQASYLSEAIKDTRSFCINLLSEDHQEISRRCASPEEDVDRFSLGEWVRDTSTGIDYLKDAQAVFFCNKTAELHHGTHFIFVGDIHSVRIGTADVKPLIYLNGKYVKAAVPQ